MTPLAGACSLEAYGDSHLALSWHPTKWHLPACLPARLL